MKFLKILTAILLGFFTAKAQNDTVYMYLGYRVSESDSFTCYKVIPPISEDGRYHVKEYDRDNSLSRELTYKNITSHNIGEHFHDTLDGKYIQYDSTGDVMEEGMMVNGDREGKWTEYYTGTTIVRYEGNWKKDCKNGIFYNYYFSGKLKRKEDYKKGKLMKGYKYDEEGKKLKFTPYWKLAEPNVNVMKWLMTNLRYPKYEKENNIEGRVIVSFSILEDGTVSEIKAINNPSEGLTNEAIRVIKSMGKWKPLVKDDIPQKVYLIQPINFKLQ